MSVWRVLILVVDEVIRGWWGKRGTDGKFVGLYDFRMKENVKWFFELVYEGE